jgi:hypothetical protein
MRGMHAESAPRGLGETPDQAAITAQLLDDSSGLREEVVREIGRHTVALLVVSRAGDIALAGTGTLVSFCDGRYILTASHVWKKGLEDSYRIALTLQEDIEHRYLLDPSEIVPTCLVGPTRWDRWGPDIALLRIPKERVVEIESRGRVVFYNLSIPRTSSLPGVVTRVLMGTPDVWGTFDRGHADLLINGSFCAADIGPFSPIDSPAHTRADFDYFDLSMDVTVGPDDYHGFSGGGLWRVFLREGESGALERIKILDGVAFHQDIADEQHLIIRCHGPQSIGSVIRSLFD